MGKGGFIITTCRGITITYYNNLGTNGSLLMPRILLLGALGHSGGRNHRGRPQPRWLRFLSKMLVRHTQLCLVPPASLPAPVSVPSPCKQPQSSSQAAFARKSKRCHHAEPRLEFQQPPEASLIPSEPSRASFVSWSAALGISYTRKGTKPLEKGNDFKYSVWLSGKTPQSTQGSFC